MLPRLPPHALHRPHTHFSSFKQGEWLRQASHAINSENEDTASSKDDGPDGPRGALQSLKMCSGQHDRTSGGVAFPFPICLGSFPHHLDAAARSTRRRDCVRSLKAINSEDVAKSSSNGELRDQRGDGEQNI